MPNRSDDDEKRERPPREGRPRLGGWDVFRLILRTYRVSLPYFLVVLLSLILATWIVTNLIF